MESAAPADPAVGAIVPLAQHAATVALLEEYRQQSFTDAETNEELRRENSELKLALGEARGALRAERGNRYRAPEWWRKLFGGRGGEE